VSNDFDDMSQGGRANWQGKNLRDDIAAILNSYEWVRVTPGREFQAGVLELPRHLKETLVPAPGVWAQELAVCGGLFGGSHAAEFVLATDRWPEPLALVCRHQASNGSAREKLCYLADTIEFRYPCPCLLLLDGPALIGDDFVLRYMRERAARSGGRIRRILAGLYDFRQWMLRGWPYPQPDEPTLL
jgi:hypothetical protein